VNELEGKYLKKEFPFTMKDFNFIRKAVYTESGIKLGTNKMAMVYSRLARRIRTLKLSSFDEYLKYLKQQKEQELDFLVDLITTNVTDFFRESHHFHFLKNDIYMKHLSDKSRKIKIWSAGCSGGQEPYSIAMTLSDIDSLTFDIFATDLSSTMLQRAQKGIYEEELIKGISESTAKLYFQKGVDENAGLFRIKPHIRNKIHFKRLNLMHEFKFQNEFDYIFCRNVIIYFDKVTKTRILRNYHKALKKDGLLFLGHSESIHGVSDLFSLYEKTTYKKVSV